MKAEDDLPWYWGTGPQTAEGDSGLRSPLGGMLAKVRDGVAGSSLREDDDDDRRIATAERMRAVKQRLAKLEADEVTHLWSHYVQKRLPFGISAAAIFTKAARSLTGEDCPDPAKLAAKMRSMNARDNRIVGLEKEADALVRAAVMAYERPSAERPEGKRQRKETRSAALAAFSEDAHRSAAGPEAVLDALDERMTLEERLAECDKILERMAEAEKAAALID